jgi:hypothetical protein
MIGKTVLLTPFWISASAMVKMASLWAHNAGITLGQLGKTGVTIALTKTFFRATATVNTVNIAHMFNGNIAANQIV